MRISDWSSDVCSSDLPVGVEIGIDLPHPVAAHQPLGAAGPFDAVDEVAEPVDDARELMQRIGGRADFGQPDIARLGPGLDDRNDVAERPLLGVGHGFLLLKGAFDIHSSSFSAVADGFTVDNSASPTASRTITGTKPA